MGSSALFEHRTTLTSCAYEGVSFGVQIDAVSGRKPRDSSALSSPIASTFSLPSWSCFPPPSPSYGRVWISNRRAAYRIGPPTFLAGRGHALLSTKPAQGLWRPGVRAGRTSAPRRRASTAAARVRTTLCSDTTSATRDATAHERMRRPLYRTHRTQRPP